MNHKEGILKLGFPGVELAVHTVHVDIYMMMRSVFTRRGSYYILVFLLSLSLH
jgi:hypothetical protein